MPELAVSSWSLHRALGPVYAGLAVAGDERAPTLPYGPGDLTLLEAPALAATLGIPSLEICQFHFPTTAPDYLDELRGRFEATGVRFLTLLIDAGDITAADPATRERELAGIERWIDVAARAGARQARVIAGDASADPDSAALRASIDGLARLAAYGLQRDVTVITENWRQLATAPTDLLAILDGTGGAVGLCADFGNYKGPGKYDDLRRSCPAPGQSTPRRTIARRASWTPRTSGAASTWRGPPASAASTCSSSMVRATSAPAWRRWPSSSARTCKAQGAATADRSHARGR